MAKHKKLHTADDSTGESNLDMAERIGRKAIAALESDLDSGEASPQTAREIGSLMRALKDIVAERRAQEKARAFTAKNLPPELVLEHLRLLQPEQRAHIIRELQRLDDTESVLG